MSVASVNVLGNIDADAMGPAALKVTCGDVLIRIDGPAKWTINRVEYKGVPLWIENSSCGTVFGFPGIGWIGTGHLADINDGSEKVLKFDIWIDGKKKSWPADRTFSSGELELCLNGKPLPSPVEELKGKEFSLHKYSRIRNFYLDCIIELKDNKLYEETSISTKPQMPIELVYNFTHAWISTATAYMSGKDGSDEINGDLKDDNDPVNTQYINREMDWMSIYDGPSRKGVVSRLVAKPESGGAVMFIRNCPGIYRKFALMSFVKQTVPANFNGKYKMVTCFFEAEKDSWQQTARDLSQNLKKNTDMDVKK